MTEQLAFAEVPATLPKKAKFTGGPVETTPSYAEVATAQKGEFLGGIFNLVFPNFSPVQRYRSEGQGIAIYDTMLRTDTQLAGFFSVMADDVLHYPIVTQPASDDPVHQEHARFVEFARKRIPHHQNVFRRILDARAYGFCVMEKMFEVVDRGEWRGAVVLRDVVDKPQRWFSFDPDRNLRFKTYKDFLPGELVDPAKFMVVTFGSNNSPWGEPVLDDCYFPWRLKHHFLEMHALWMEKWAQPTPKVGFKWNKDQKITAANREEALRVAMAIQRDQVIAFPEGMDVGLLESLRSGSISYESAISMCTDMQALLVTGQKLAVMAGNSGSYRQAAIHQIQLSNKVEMLAGFASSQVSRQIIRDLIDRNYGPQDTYPVAQILARDPVDLQAQAAVERMQMDNGHELSKNQSRIFSMIVPPSNAADKLAPLAGVTGTVPLVNPTLASGAATSAEKILFAKSGGYQSLHTAAKGIAAQKLAQTNGRAAKALGHAKPAMKKIVKSLGSAIKQKKSVSRVTKASVFKAFKGVSGADQLGQAFDVMINA